MRFACESGPARAYKKLVDARAATCNCFALMSSDESRKPITRSDTMRYVSFQDWVNKQLHTPGNAYERKYCNASNLSVLPTPVGSGSYGTVLPVVIAGDTSKKYVLKCCVDEEDNQRELTDSMKTEIKAFERLKGGHPNIIEVIDIIQRESAGCVFFLMEYFPDGTLKNFVLKLMAMDADQKKFHTKEIMRQLLEAVLFMHEKGVYHRDLKPENILMDRDQIRITDLGLAFLEGDPEKEDDIAYTVTYRPPEVMLRLFSVPLEDLPKGDIWSVACVIAFLLTGRDAFPHTIKVDPTKFKVDPEEASVLLGIFKTLGTPTNKTWPGVYKLPGWSDGFPPWLQRSVWRCKLWKGRVSPVIMAVLKEALVVNPAKRASAAELVQVFQAFHDAI